MKHLIPLLAMSCLAAGLCFAAGLIPALPPPKKYPADMLRSFLSTTSITAQVNGDVEDVEIKYFKRLEFTGTDPSPFADEAKTVVLSTNIFLFKVVTERPRVQPKRLTREEWEMMQPIIPPPMPRP